MALTVFSSAWRWRARVTMPDSAADKFSRANAANAATRLSTPSPLVAELD
jgi:hypothetical protein